MPQWDAGAATQNILLVAHYLNLGACWVNATNFNKKEIKESFSISEDYDIAAIVPIGHTDQIPTAPGRKDVKSMISYEKFGSVEKPYHEQ